MIQNICNLATKKSKPVLDSFIRTLSFTNRMNYETLNLKTVAPFVINVQLNRPENLNTMNDKMWTEIGECFNHLNLNKDCRVIVLSGNGKLFSAGIDFKEFINMAPKINQESDIARKCKIVYEMIKKYQTSLTAIEKCCKPVICAVHGACIGGSVDLICSADIRYCSKDAWFQIKETDIGMAADVGTLQRLPKIIKSQSLVNELCFTARKLNSSEALECGFVSKILDNEKILLDEAIQVATNIAKKSPVAVQLTKKTLVYSRDHSVEDSLEYIAIWNQTMLQSEDFSTAVAGEISKDDKVEFAKL